MVEIGATMVAYIWSLAGVHVDMNLKMLMLSKSCLAHITFKWLLAGVCANVALKIGRHCRRVGTIWATMQDHRDFKRTMTDDDDF